MTCEQCGAPHRSDVQFKTDEDWQEVYENGQQVPEDDGLAPGQSFDGCVNRFCPDCYRRWRADNAGESMEVLARYVEQGRLTVRAKDAPVYRTAKDLRGLGQATRQAILDDPTDGRQFPKIYYDRFAWDGEELANMGSRDGTGADFAARRQADVGKALEAAGWPLGKNWLRRGLQVCIGDDMKIIVRTAEGGVIPQV